MSTPDSTIEQFDKTDSVIPDIYVEIRWNYVEITLEFDKTFMCF